MIFLELAEKSKYLAANMVSIDICEIANLDNFKEAYPFTVRIVIIMFMLINHKWIGLTLSYNKLSLHMPSFKRFYWKSIIIYTEPTK